ncbi:LCDV1 orf2-like protein [Frankliniella fusca]|uniref:LCDV1 orf2-like protein n=1 Tax=Frankliniella fusca TaxID=407009 RepID=A0AAE1GUA1_9NEOP|nr:LCDV1 orf2-like protein [Frankliniella fusca]
MSFHEILSAERRRIPDRVVRSELTLRRLRPAMQRARSDLFPYLPSSLEQLTVTLENPAWRHLTETLDREGSIYLGSTRATDGSHRIGDGDVQSLSFLNKFTLSVVFCSARCLEVMKIVDTLFADGTFYFTPSIENCYQRRREEPSPALRTTWSISNVIMPANKKPVWEHYKVLDVTVDGKPSKKYVCKYCGHSYLFKNASKKLKHLLTQCKKIPGLDKAALEDSSSRQPSSSGENEEADEPLAVSEIETLEPSVQRPNPIANPLQNQPRE